MAIGKSSSRKFVLSVGDEGAILVLAEKNKMIKRMFVASASEREYRNMLLADPDAPIYILVDIVDQAYISTNLPPVSKGNVSKLVKRKLSKDFDSNDLNAAVLLGRDKTGKKEWKYLFISVRNQPPLTDWVDAVSELPNPFKGLYLLPTESRHLVNDLRKVVAVDRRKKGSKWQIMVSHNRVGGFRQIVFCDGNVVFTRMAQTVGGQTPEIIAGNIEQETINTIEYIRRLGYMEDDGLEIFIITSAEVKHAMEVSAFPTEVPVIITPYEISTHLGLENAAETKDRFGDVISGMHFLKSLKPCVVFHTPYTTKINNLVKATGAIKAGGMLVALLLLATAGFSFFQSFGIKAEIEKQNTQIASQNQELEKLKSATQKYDRDPKIIADVVKIHTQLQESAADPLELLRKLKFITKYVAQPNHAEVSYKAVSENEPRVVEGSLDITFDINDYEGQEQLLESVDRFGQEMYATFPDNSVSIGGMPESGINVTLDKDATASQETTYPLKITISKKKADEPARR